MATNDKYDRQLRLWGASGQKSLGKTCVVLVRATASGTETCKNLVLPGIGAILVLDDAETIGTEFSSNFFLTQSNTTCRAKMALEYLQELNPDVEGSWKHTEDLMKFDFAATFAAQKEGQIDKLLVVASDLETPLLMKVATVCDAERVPLVAVHSYGLMGIVRLQTPPLPLLNPKPRDVLPDLRLLKPFGALQEMAASIQWDMLENHEHGHIPFPLILLRSADKWRDQHEGQLPQNFSEKQEFQESVKEAARRFDQELNFQEAVRNAYLAYSARELDTEHLVSLRKDADRDVSGLLVALESFCQRHDGQPPLHGSIPDMTASTELYIQLQTLYREQAEKDLEEMKSLLSYPVSDELIKLFCQNVYSLDILKTRTLMEEYNEAPDEELCEDLAMATMEGDERPEQLPLLWYLGYRSCQNFHTERGRYPGTTEDYEADVATLQESINDVVKRYKLQDNDTVKSTLLKCQDYATEMVRYGNAEIHTIASVVGGVASQEAVKIITSQYVPFNNTYVYNGISSSGAVYKF